MDLSLESYRTIVKNVRSRADIAVLCRVSKTFQQVAERALYNTLFLRVSEANNGQAIALCKTLETQPRVAVLVDALTVLVADSEYPSREDDADGEMGEEEGDYENDEEELAVALRMSLAESAGLGEGSSSSGRRSGHPSLDDCWKHVSRALQRTVRLRHLNIHITNNVEASVSWVLDGCTFQLRSFHCDLSWDRHLVSFLNTQDDLEDLYIIDFVDPDSLSHSVSRLDAGSVTPTQRSAETVRVTASHDTPESALPSHGLSGSVQLSSSRLASSISLNALRSLSILECTFTEAAFALVPGRPVVRLKTAFSSSSLSAKHTEMNSLFSCVRRSTRRIKSLDIGDSVYGEEFAMDMLQTIVATSRTRDDLRYLGTLVLPVGGNERLMFYALLRRIHRLGTVELDVTSWEPPPVDAGPPAFRALANELRIYCRSIKKVIFVYEFERTVVKVVDGVMKVDMGRETTPTETLWREV